MWLHVLRVLIRILSLKLVRRAVAIVVVVLDRPAIVRLVLLVVFFTTGGAL